MRLFSLTSSLHEEMIAPAREECFIQEIEAALGCSFEHMDEQLDLLGDRPDDVLYVRTGGTEGIFRKFWKAEHKFVRILTSGQSNSLAASMEIVSYLRQQGARGHIFHGPAADIASSLTAEVPVSPVGCLKVLKGLALAPGPSAPAAPAAQASSSSPDGLKFNQAPAAQASSSAPAAQASSSAPDGLKFNQAPAAQASPSAPAAQASSSAPDGLKFNQAPVAQASPSAPAASAALAGARLGVVGRPSDWLISSDVDYAKAKAKLGVELIDIPMAELLDEVSKLTAPLPSEPLPNATGLPAPEQQPNAPEPLPNATGQPALEQQPNAPEPLPSAPEPLPNATGLPAPEQQPNAANQPRCELPIRLNAVNPSRYGRPISEECFSQSLRIYTALKRIAERYRLDGLSLRCFDLLTALGNTGCLALAILNSEGITATCEGDVPALLTMELCKRVCGTPGFQVNLSRIEKGTALFAHCTVPLNLVRSYCYDTHFESGIGVAIHGEFEPCAATIVKIGASLDEFVAEEVSLVANSYGNNLCRTQVLIKGPDGGPFNLSEYFLTSSLGNHHVIVPGRWAAALRSL